MSLPNQRPPPVPLSNYKMRYKLISQLGFKDGLKLCKLTYVMMMMMMMMIMWTKMMIMTTMSISNII